MKVHDVAEYVTWNLPPPEFYIKDILPKQGAMLVYGSPKVKKSWLTQHMGYCIATGSEWVGFKTEQARVFIAQFEISERAYYWRLKAMANNYHLQSQMFFEVSPGLMYIDQNENFNRLSAVIREHKPQVIFLDCLASCFGGDENNNEHIANFIQKIEILKTEHEASVVIVHHTNKNVLAISSVDKARGHSRLAGWVDTLMFMGEQPTGVQLQIKSRQATRELSNVNISFENYDWHVR